MHYHDTIQLLDNQYTFKYSDFATGFMNIISETGNGEAENNLMDYKAYHIPQESPRSFHSDKASICLQTYF